MSARRPRKMRRLSGGQLPRRSMRPGDSRMCTEDGTSRGASRGFEPSALRQTASSSTRWGWPRSASHAATPELVVPRSRAQPGMPLPPCEGVAYPGRLTVPAPDRLTQGMADVEADTEAVAGVRQGDVGAFRHLVERHTAAVHRLAYRMTGNAQDAEDVVQETFLRAFKRLDHFEARAQFGSWLHRIGANCA